MPLDRRIEAVALAYARETFPLADRLDRHMEEARREAIRFLAMLDAAQSAPAADPEHRDEAEQ